METIIFMALVIGGPGLLALVLGGMYMSDPKGWNATVKRISTMSRASLEARKEAKAIGPSTSVEDWDRQFNGNQLAIDSGEKHYIVKSWIRKDRKIGYSYITCDYFHWKCVCGDTDRRDSEADAHSQFKEHKKEADRDEKEKLRRAKIKEEYKRKGLDREW